jgi:hypothetical protein
MTPDEALDRLHRAGWSIGDTRGGRTWIVGHFHGIPDFGVSPVFHPPFDASVDVSNGTSLTAPLSSMSCGIAGKQAAFDSSNSAVSP